MRLAGDSWNSSLQIHLVSGHKALSPNHHTLSLVCVLLCFRDLTIVLGHHTEVLRFRLASILRFHFLRNDHPLAMSQDSEKEKGQTDSPGPREKSARAYVYGTETGEDRIPFWHEEFAKTRNQVTKEWARTSRMLSLPRKAINPFQR